MHCALVITPAPGIKVYAIASYFLFHSYAQVTILTDLPRWTGHLLYFERNKMMSYHSAFTHQLNSLFFMLFYVMCIFHMAYLCSTAISYGYILHHYLVPHRVHVHMACLLMALFLKTVSLVWFFSIQMSSIKKPGRIFPCIVCTATWA